MEKAILNVVPEQSSDGDHMVNLVCIPLTTKEAVKYVKSPSFTRKNAKVMHMKWPRYTLRVIYIFNYLNYNAVGKDNK